MDSGSILHPPNVTLLSDELLGRVKYISRARSGCVDELNHNFGFSMSPDQRGELRRAVWEADPAEQQQYQLNQYANGDIGYDNQQSFAARVRLPARHQTNLVKIRGNEVQQLRAEVKALEHRVVTFRRPTESNLWSTVSQYFHLFRYGAQLTGDQMRFVQAKMAPDGVFNSEYGPEAIVRSWCFSQWFDAVEVELTSLHKTTEDSVVAITKTSVTITSRTLANVFSHLISSRADRRLADKLVGQRIVMYGSTSFGWNRSIGRLASMISQSDMVTPMLRLLGTLDDVSRVFEHALISPEFQWRTMLQHD